MSDQYRAQVRNVAGRAVALVEVEIKRTLFIDAHVWAQIKDKIGNNAENAVRSGGMERLRSWWQTASTLPSDALPYFSIPWSDSDAAAIALLPLTEIEQLTSNQTYFRVEGSPAGYTGIINVGGRETRHDMSLAGIPAFNALIAKNLAEVDAEIAAGSITKQEADTIKEFCRVMGEVSGRCEKTMRDALTAQREADRRTREHEQQKVHDSDFGNLHETHRGDFGPGVGRDFSRTA